jgi:hypothetical protein
MELYANRSGKSGIKGFETGADYIKIWFTSFSEPYLYTYQKPGKRKVERMKKLALLGKGLSTYISQYVKKDYWRKESYH